MATKKTAQPVQQEKIVAKTPDRSPGNLPPDVAADLKECFDHYLEEGEYTIPYQLFKNILQNFGFHRMGPREIEEELKKSDPDLPKRNAFDF